MKPMRPMIALACTLALGALACDSDSADSMTAEEIEEAVPDGPDQALVDSYVEEHGDDEIFFDVLDHGIREDMGENALDDLGLRASMHSANGWDGSLNLNISDFADVSESDRIAACEATSAYLAGDPETLEIHGPMLLTLSGQVEVDDGETTSAPLVYNDSIRPGDAGECATP